MNTLPNMAQLNCLPLVTQLMGHAGRKAIFKDVVMSQLASCLGLTSVRMLSSMKTLDKRRKKPTRSLLLPQQPPCQTRHKATKSDDIISKLTPEAWNCPYESTEPELDWPFLLDGNNTDSIARNIASRKGVGDIQKVISLSHQYDQENQPEKEEVLKQKLITSALDIPNLCHPNTIIGDESCAKVLETFGEKKEFDLKVRRAEEACEKWGILRTKNMKYSHSDMTYYLEDDLARLERALVNFTLDYLRNLEFEFVTVPDILYSDVVDGCGFKTDIESNNAVYHLHPDCLPRSVLAGTSEMSLAGFYNNEVFHLEDLPTRLTAVSTCYRAEVSGLLEDLGLYRVHHFTKVEMFGLTANEFGSESEELLETFLSIQRDLFSQLGLHFRVLDMPSQELGAPAYKKYDIESWMHAKERWGEISSCSNCTDYQSRRLNIKYEDPDGQLKHVHTVNGTACAVPRLLISLIEQGQERISKYGYRIVIPEVLRPYMGGQEDIRREKKDLKTKYIYQRAASTLKRIKESRGVNVDED